MSDRETLEAKVTHHFSAEPDAVFDALTDEKTVRRWNRVWLIAMGLPGDVVRCNIDPREGEGFEMIDRRDDGEARHWGRYEVLDRPKRIRFSWIADESEEANPSMVTIILEPAQDEEGTDATLYNEIPDASEEMAAEAERSWLAMLGAIDGILHQDREPDSEA